MSSTRHPNGASSRTPLPAASLWVLALVGVCLAVFGASLFHPYGLFDDDDYITRNPHVLAGLTRQSIAWAFTTGHASNWHPLTWLSLMLDVSLMGAHPSVFHATNILLHAANAALLFLCLRLLWRGVSTNPAQSGQSGLTCVESSRRPDSLALADWAAFVAAAFWAWHPLRVESVAWIAERKDVLAAFFGLLALYLCARQWPERQPLPWSAWVCFVLGCLAKPTLVMMPITLAVLAWLMGVRPRWSIIRRLAAWCAISLGLAVVTMAVQRAGGAMSLMEHVALPVRLANAVVSVSVYLRQTLWPSDLAVFYLFRPHQSLLRVGGGAFVLLGLGLACLPGVCRRWNRPGLSGCGQLVAAGVVWYLVNLVPVLGIVQVGQQAHADRYTYWPGLGLAMVLLAGLLAAGMIRSRQTVASPAAASDDGGPGLRCRARVLHEGESRPHRGLLVLATTLCVVHGVLAFRQTALWRAPEQLVEQMIAVGGELPDARINLGAIFAEQGRLHEAVAQFRKGLAVRESADDYVNLAAALKAMRQYPEAREAAERAIRLKPDFTHAWALAGLIATEARQWEDAAECLKEARRLTTLQKVERPVPEMVAELERRLAEP